jgi:excisionase family DNA binding protein
MKETDITVHPRTKKGDNGMLCKKCQAPLQLGAAFCGICGKKAPPPPKEKKVIDLSSKLGFSVAEAAAAVGVSTWFIYEEIKTEAIGHCKLHGRKVIPRWALDEYLRRHEIPAKEVAQR